jgi:hypothetical protein
MPYISSVFMAHRHGLAFDGRDIAFLERIESPDDGWPTRFDGAEDVLRGQKNL